MTGPTPDALHECGNTSALRSVET